jgi:DNA processing protein
MATGTVQLLQIMQTKGIGPRALSRLLDRLENDELTLQDFLRLETDDLVARFGITQEQARSIQANEETAGQVAELLDEHGVRTLMRGSSLYPARLRTALGDKAPPVLFVAGSADLLQGRGVGFCGARDASDEALRCADQMARALAKQGLLVVSGHAPGVDETAHRAALEAGGATMFVLPEGILHFRPRASVADLMSPDRFVVVSEFPPRLPWSVANAMQRNRTICGLVQALIVVEAGTSGGTWEGGQEALKLGVPLFVLDFAEPAPSAQGNRLLIKKGGQALACRAGEPPDVGPLQDALATMKLGAKEQMLF